MGKSWGARMAAEAGALEEVVAVALVVPALSGPVAARLLPKIHGSMAVCLARGDPVVDYAQASKNIQNAVGKREVTWVEVEGGGHRIADEFVSPLVHFAEQARPAFAQEASEPLEL
mmetsp:Transcript_88781/g.276275  ORF Transcript_88781/g.276275 Transcript_88781/m.276275 type:complete len:116 (-) Transcript_88781:70-417(-)